MLYLVKSVFNDSIFMDMSKLFLTFVWTDIIVILHKDEIICKTAIVRMSARSKNLGCHGDA